MVIGLPLQTPFKSLKGLKFWSFCVLARQSIYELSTNTKGYIPCLRYLEGHFLQIAWKLAVEPIIGLARVAPWRASTGTFSGQALGA